MVMSTDLGTTHPCSGPGVLFFSQLFSNSLIIHEADISARRVQRVNIVLQELHCFTVYCDYVSVDIEYT